MSGTASPDDKDDNESDDDVDDDDFWPLDTILVCLFTTFFITLSPETLRSTLRSSTIGRQLTCSLTFKKASADIFTRVHDFICPLVRTGNYGTLKC